MGRIGFTTAINRMISASNRRQREREREELIHQQGGNKKELPPTYSLVSVDFNINSRVAKIEFEQTQQYRTIERYVTQNYVRYPIFSNWKVKRKTIKKTLKLTNKELEDLQHHEDPLVRKFADEIVIALNNEDLFPSWLIKAAIQSECDEKINYLDDELSKFTTLTNQKIGQCAKEINNNRDVIAENNKILKIKIAKSDKIFLKIQKISEAKKSVVKSIFTLFIYNYYISSHRKKKLTSLKVILENEIKTLQEKNSTLSQSSKDLMEQIRDYQNKLNEKSQDIEKQKNRIQVKCEEDLQNVTTLDIAIAQDSDFIPLKKFVGLEYEKIIGCYAIHNIVNDKYYVGQSKDVMKRLRQHFKGTVPSNIIFAEDYYSQKEEDRESLFELKIIPCETKDELDRTEKQLIEEYDAFQSGYNGTNGNT